MELSLDSPLNCTRVVAQETLWLLGDNPSCTWASDDEMNIYLGNNAMILLGDEVVIRNETMTAICDEGYFILYMPEYRPLLFGPDAYPDLRAVVRTTSHFDSCAKILVSAEISTGSGGRPLTYDWTLLRAFSNQGEDISTEESALIATIDSISNSTLEFEGIPGATHEILLVITNWLGMNATSLLNATKLNSTDPRVPLVLLNVGDYVEIYEENYITIRGSIADPEAIEGSCAELNSSNVEYTWVQVAGPSYNIETPSAPLINFARFSLEPDETYSFQLTSNMKDTPAYTTTSFVDVLVKPVLPIVTVDFCNRIVPFETSDTSVTYTVRANSSTLATSNGTVTGSSLLYRWECMGMYEDGFGSEIYPCILDNVVNISSLSVFGNLEISAGSFNKSNTTYLLRVVVSNPENADSVSSMSCYLKTSDEIAAQIYVQKSINLHKSQNIATFTARSFSGISGLDFSWECAKGPGRTFCEPEVMNAASGIKTNRLLVDTSVLSSGIEYHFTVLGTASSGIISLLSSSADGEAFESLIVPSAPFGGSCELQRESGEAFNTNFFIVCSGFTSSSSLRTSVQLQSNETLGLATVPLCSRTMSPVCASTMPFSTVQGENEYTLLVTVIDANEQAVQFTLTPIVISKEITTEFATQIISVSITTLTTTVIDNADIDLAGVSVSNALVGANSTENTATVITTLITAITSISTNIPDTSDNLITKTTLFSMVVQSIPVAQIETEAASQITQSVGETTQRLINSDDLDYSDDFGTETASVLVSIVAVVQDRTATTNDSIANVSTLVDRTIATLASAMGTSGLDVVTITLTSFQLTSETIPEGGSFTIIDHNLETNGAQPSFEVDPAVFEAVVGALDNVRTVLGTTDNYWPVNVVEDATGYSIVNSLSLLIGGERIEDLGLSISGLSNADRIKVTIPLGDLDAADDFSCYYYDEEKEEWSTAGVLVEEIGEDYIVCSTNHLTSFQLVSTPNTVALSDDDVYNINFENIGRNPFIATALGFVFLCYLLFTWGAKVKAKRKYRSLKINPDIELDEFILQWYHQFVYHEIEREIKKLEESQTRSRLDSTIEGKSIITSDGTIDLPLLVKRADSVRAYNHDVLSRGYILGDDPQISERKLELRSKARNNTPTRTASITKSVQKHQRSRSMLEMMNPLSPRKKQLMVPRSASVMISKADELAMMHQVAGVQKPDDLALFSHAAAIQENSSRVMSMRRSKSPSRKPDKIPQIVSDHSRQGSKLDDLLAMERKASDTVEEKDEKLRSNLQRQRRIYQDMLSPRRMSVQIPRQRLADPKRAKSLPDILCGRCFTDPRVAALRKNQKLLKTQVLTRMKLHLIDRHDDSRLLSNVSLKKAMGRNKKNEKRRRKLARMLKKISAKAGAPMGVSKGRKPPSCHMITKLFNRKMKHSHMWVSVLARHRRDPFTSQWRANILLLSLLLILCFNGFFYEVDNTFSTEIMIGIVTAVLVSLIDVVFILTAKKIGKIKWEIRICELRQRLCVKVGTGAIRPAVEEKKPNGLDSKYEDDGLSTHGSGMTRETGIGVGRTLEDADGRKQIQKMQRHLYCISWSANISFFLLVSGCVFSILLLGIKFDLNSENEGSGLRMQDSESFKWLMSCVVAEGFRSILALPVVLLVQACAMYLCTVLVPTLVEQNAVDWLVNDEDLEELMAYDVFERANKGYTLNQDGCLRLHKVAANRTKLSFSMSQTRSRSDSDSYARSFVSQNRGQTGDEKKLGGLWADIYKFDEDNKDYMRGGSHDFGMNSPSNAVITARREIQLFDVPVVPIPSGHTDADSPHSMMASPRSSPRRSPRSYTAHPVTGKLSPTRPPFRRTPSGNLRKNFRRKASKYDNFPSAGHIEEVEEEKEQEQREDLKFSKSAHTSPKKSSVRAARVKALTLPRPRGPSSRPVYQRRARQSNYNLPPVEQEGSVDMSSRINISNVNAMSTAAVVNRSLAFGGRNALYSQASVPQPPPTIQDNGSVKDHSSATMSADESGRNRRETRQQRPTSVRTSIRRVQPEDVKEEKKSGNDESSDKYTI